MQGCIDHHGVLGIPDLVAVRDDDHTDLVAVRDNDLDAFVAVMHDVLYAFIAVKHDELNPLVAVWDDEVKLWKALGLLIKVDNIVHMLTYMPVPRR